LVIDTDDASTYLAVMQRARELGGRGLLGLPPTLVFGRFPQTVAPGDFGDLPVLFAANSDEIDPITTDLITLRCARGLLDERIILRQAGAFIPLEPFEDRLLRVPR
jgi:hypothetical protein